LDVSLRVLACVDGSRAAATLIGAVDALRASLACARYPRDQLEIDALRSRLRAELGDDSFASCIMAGEVMDLATAKDFALSAMEEGLRALLP
jgi:hypothetical protein